MIPLRDTVPTRTVPFVTFLLITANIVTFIYELSLSASRELEPFIREHALIAARFFQEGGPDQWLTILTSMFLHGGFLHLAGNMLYLWVFGNNIEDAMGHVKFLFFYLLCGGAAAGAQLWIDPEATMPMLGASGAISGVLGAYLLLFPRARVLTLVPFFFLWFVEIRAVFFLVYWILLQLINGLPSLLFASARHGGGVAWWAHIGGFIAGLVLILFFKQRRARLFR